MTTTKQSNRTAPCLYKGKLFVGQIVGLENFPEKFIIDSLFCQNDKVKKKIENEKWRVENYKDEAVENKEEENIEDESEEKVENKEEEENVENEEENVENEEENVENEKYPHNN